MVFCSNIVFALVNIVSSYQMQVRMPTLLSYKHIDDKNHHDVLAVMMCRIHSNVYERSYAGVIRIIIGIMRIMHMCDGDQYV